MTTGTVDPGPQVQHFRQVLLWPLSVSTRGVATGHPPWHALRDQGEGSHWREQVDEYTGDPAKFHERHYQEFVTFLPYVQHFLFGEGRATREAGGEGSDADAPMRVFRRRDVAAVRVVTRPGSAPITLNVVHVDLYFFFDVDVVLLNVEVETGDLTLEQAQELLYRFGRGYPPGWDEQSQPMHCLLSAEWLDSAGRVLAASDTHERELYVAHVARHRAPRIAAHWAWMLAPLVADHSDQDWPLHYRQIEYHRMPVMAFLALRDPRGLTRSDWVRLGLVTGAGGSVGAESGLPYA